MRRSQFFLGSNGFFFPITRKITFRGLHQVILPNVTSYHFPILLEVGGIHSGKRHFKFENVSLKVDGFSDLMKSF